MSKKKSKAWSIEDVKRLQKKKELLKKTRKKALVAEQSRRTFFGFQSSV